MVRRARTFWFQRFFFKYRKKKIRKKKEEKRKGENVASRGLREASEVSTELAEFWQRCTYQNICFFFPHFIVSFSGGSESFHNASLLRGTQDARRYGNAHARGLAGIRGGVCLTLKNVLNKSRKMAPSRGGRVPRRQTLANQYRFPSKTRGWKNDPHARFSSHVSRYQRRLAG